MEAGAAKYLEENVGGVLAKALAEMAVVQPKARGRLGEVAFVQP